MDPDSGYAKNLETATFFAAGQSKFVVTGVESYGNRWYELEGPRGKVEIDFSGEAID